MSGHEKRNYNEYSNEHPIVRTHPETGKIIEERKDMDLVRKADAFLLAAQEGKIELIIDLLKPCLAQAPIYDYIARKLKTNEKSNNN